MNCPLEHELNDYAVGRLSTARRWQISQHLASCAACRGAVGELEAVGAWLDDLPTPAEHPEDVLLAAVASGAASAAERAEVLAHVGQCPECAYVLGQLRRETAAAAVARPARSWVKWSSLAAAAAVLVIVGGVLLRGPYGARPGPSAAGAPGLAAERSPAAEKTRPAAPLVAARPTPRRVVQQTSPLLTSPEAKARVKRHQEPASRATQVAWNASTPAPRPRRTDSLDGEALALAPPAKSVPLDMGNATKMVPCPADRALGAPPAVVVPATPATPLVTPTPATPAPAAAGGMAGAGPGMPGGMAKSATAERTGRPEGPQAEARPQKGGVAMHAADRAPQSAPTKPKARPKQARRPATTHVGQRPNITPDDLRNESKRFAPNQK